MSVFDLMATLGLDKSGYDEGLKSAEGTASGFGAKFGKAVGSAAKTAGVALAAVGAGAAALTKEMMKGAGEVAAFGDSIDKGSQKLGISAEAYQEWDFILQHSGSSVAALTPAIRTLSNAAESGSDAFERLGISQEQAASMPKEDLFAAVVTGLQGVTDENERAAIATKLFGRSSMEMGALLNTSAEDTAAMREQVHTLGGVMSGEAVKAAAGYQDSLQNLTTATDGLKRGLLQELLPGITTAMDGITALFTGDTEGGLAQISTGIDMLASSLSEKLPVFAEVAANIIESIGMAIINNLPTIIDSASTIVLELAGALINELPTIVKAIVQIAIQLANSITQQLPVLLPAIIDCVVAIAKALVDNAPMIVKAGFELLIAIVKELPSALVHILSGVGDILNGIFKTIGEAFGKMADIGKKLIEGLWQGIKNAGNWLWDKISGFFDGIWSGIKKLFGIHSPSTLFRDELGKNLMLGFAEGIDRYGDMGVRAIDDWADDINAAARVDEFGMDNGSIAGGGNARKWNIVQNVYAYEMSPVEAFEAAQQAAQTAEYLGLA